MNRQKKTFHWYYEKDEMLIELVKTKTELYDLTSPLYSDNVVKRRSWLEIGSHLGYEGSECKDRWESLRSQYRKRVNKKTKIGQAPVNNQKWKYEDQMSFLSAFKKDRTRTISLQQAGNGSEDLDNTDQVGTKEQCSGQDGEKDVEDDTVR
ncbi:hypothetical protein SK128_004946 [Halocaridina rubra]|uniref:MADF domain-containing protein n=1 Tax=Halocaridina rubra TaxID=373956 RepID=A0AAN9AC95_HALRR